MLSPFKLRLINRKERKGRIEILLSHFAFYASFAVNSPVFVIS